MILNPTRLTSAGLYGQDAVMKKMVRVDIGRPNAGQGDRGIGWTTLKWLTEAPGQGGSLA